MPSTMISRIDGLTTSVAVKPPIKIMTSSHITLVGEQIINSVTPDGSAASHTALDGDRIGVNGQIDKKQNGIYVCRTTAWERAKDFDGSLDAVYGTLVTDSIPVIWRLITPIPVLFGTSDIEFETEAGFNQGNLQDLANTTDPYLGSGMVGRQPLQINTVAELRLTHGRFDGDVAKVKNYLSGDTKGADIPADWVVVQAPALPPADDGGMIIRVAGVSNAYWRRRLNKRGMVDGEVYGLPLAAGQDPYDKLEAIAAYCAATKISCFLGKGPLDKGMFVSVPVYDTFERSMPFSGPRDPGFALVNFGYETWSEPGTIFQTTSSGGADVWNLCSMENWGLRGFPTIRGFLTSFTGSGSNAVSMVYGVRNIVIEAYVENMPTIWLPGGGSDGGHGFTIQFAGGTINPVENITFRGTVKGCTSGVNIDASMTDTVSRPYSNILIDNVEAEDCWYGFVATTTTPSVSIVDPRVPQPCISVSGRMSIKNAQRGVFAARLFGSDLNFEIYNNKEKAALVRNPNDTSVYVATVVGVKHSKIAINARAQSLDTVVTCGAITMGGNAYPSIENSELDIDVRYTTATTEFDLGLAATPPCMSSSVRLTGFVNIPQAFITASLRTRVTLNGADAVPTLFPGDGNAEPSPGPLTYVIYSVPVTATRTVFTPLASLSAVGDTVVVVRTSAATGSGVSAFGVSIAANTKTTFVYSGAAWLQLP